MSGVAGCRVFEAALLQDGVRVVTSSHEFLPGDTLILEVLEVRLLEG
jgi:hypothetical protein